MRRPNRSGSVIKLSGKRRRPYAIRVWDGVKINSQGKATPKYKYVGYYEKSSDALRELEKYNTSPVEVYKAPESERTHKFTEIYAMWCEERDRSHAKPLSTSTIRAYQAAYKNLSPLHNMAFEKITVEDIEKAALENADKSSSTMNNIRIILKGMYKTALRHKFVSEDLSTILLLNAKNENRNPHIPFNDDEIAILWANKEDFYPRILLILIYTGMRVNELLTMKSEQVFLEERYMIGGLKTEAGKNRRIPISEKIVPLLDTSHEYLIANNDNKYQYSRLRAEIPDILPKYGISKHMFHDTRHTCASLMERANIPLYHRKLILGHAIADITEGKYTHVDISKLIDDINKI